MMKRKWQVSLGVLGILVLLLTVGFTKVILPTEHHLNMSTGNYPSNANMKAGWQKRFGVDSDHGVSIVADLKMSPHGLLGEKSKYVSGAIVLKTPTGTFPVTLGPRESLSLVTLPDGTLLYYGMLAGTMKGAKGTEESVAMLVAFSLEGAKQYMTLAVGGIGDETEFVFGESFFTEDIMAAIRAQLAQ